jgi:hypothetical protein
VSVMVEHRMDTECDARHCVTALPSVKVRREGMRPSRMAKRPMAKSRMPDPTVSVDVRLPSSTYAWLQSDPGGFRAACERILRAATKEDQPAKAPLIAQLERDLASGWVSESARQLLVFYLIKAHADHCIERLRAALGEWRAQTVLRAAAKEVDNETGIARWEKLVCLLSVALNDN